MKVSFPFFKLKVSSSFFSSVEIITIKMIVLAGDGVGWVYSCGR